MTVAPKRRPTKNTGRGRRAGWAGPPGVGSSADGAATAPRNGGGILAAAPQNARTAKATMRREAILAAALEEFSARGYAAARLDDVARRAGVAKGTIYLYFEDKEALLRELILFQLNPVVDAFETTLAGDLPLAAIVDGAMATFVDHVYGTRRQEVIRLIITEGPHFPALAEFYHREVLSRIFTALRARLVRARERGEIVDDALIRFPQLLGAAAIMAVLWKSLFDRFDPLDVRAMLRVYFDHMLPTLRRSP
jgi:AcrR family transcriptional regulator